MACHEVETHLDAAFVGFVDECDQISVGTEARVYLVEINDIVAAVKPSRLKAGVDPQSVDTQALDIIEFGGDAGQVSDAVAVGVHIRRGIDLVEHSVVEPLWSTRVGGLCRSRCER